MRIGEPELEVIIAKDRSQDSAKDEAESRWHEAHVMVLDISRNRRQKNV